MAATNSSLVDSKWACMADVAFSPSRYGFRQIPLPSKGIFEDGRKVTLELFREVMAQEMEKINASIGDKQFARGRYALAAQLFDDIVTGDTLEEFLTLRAYEHLD
jgi:hypothetical protein